MKKILVLLIDDMSDIRLLMKSYLKMNFADIEVDEAGNGTKALDKMRRKRYDIVLCDWELPDMSGHEILAWFKGQENLKGVPFVMVTSHHKKEHLLKAMEAGVNDYITKPLSPDLMIKKFAQALKIPVPER